jgi:hypothetical protein
MGKIELQIPARKKIKSFLLLNLNLSRKLQTLNPNLQTWKHMPTIFTKLPVMDGNIICLNS